MADTSRWVGAKTLEQQKLKWSFTSEGQTLVVPFVGPYSECLARRPRPGQVLAGFDTDGLRVVSCEVLEGDAGSGTLNVSLAASTVPGGGGGDVTFAPLGEPIYEIVWEELTKRLEQHEDCGTLKPNRPIDDATKRQKTWEDWPALTAADYDASGGKWSLATYKSKKEKGIEEFSIAFPVVRRTITYLRQPAGVGDGCFESESPPGAAGAPSSAGGKALHYIKATEHLRKQGRVRTLETEWRGAWRIDHDLYP